MRRLTASKNSVVINKNTKSMIVEVPMPQQQQKRFIDITTTATTTETTAINKRRY
jgi:hypothetical protein